VGVSGGADSMALAVLARGWARARGGDVLALVADHGLRAESADEAELTRRRLAAEGIASRVLRLGLAAGTRLAERAREARLAALEAAAVERGILHLLLAHHAGDQAETMLMRLLRRSGPDGLAGMAALRETAGVRVLRPLLTVAPGRLRALLAGAGVAWVEDPSNRDPRTVRGRLRALLGDADGSGGATQGLVAASLAYGAARAAREREMAAWLAGNAWMANAWMGGRAWAVLPAGPWPEAAAAALIRAVSGRAHLAPGAVARLAAAPRAATLGGARLRAGSRRNGAAGGWRLEPERAGGAEQPRPAAVAAFMAAAPASFLPPDEKGDARSGGKPYVVAMDCNHEPPRREAGARAGGLGPEMGGTR
jgi:tRNA(Ile)-lysidine synthase